VSKILFVSRTEGEKYAQCDSSDIAAFDVSSKASPPFDTLSPFCYSNDFKIPVPGMKNTFSHSVEGIWEGLKLIAGDIDPGFFKRKPKKRKGIVEGHKYEDRLLEIIEARRRIYMPSYFFYLDNHAPKDAINEILREQRHGKKIYVYDVEENGNLKDPRPYAHAAALAWHLNCKIFNSKLEPTNDAERQLYAILDSNTDIVGKVAAIQPLLSDPDIEKAFTFRCIEHPTIRADHLVAKVIEALNKNDTKAIKRLDILLKYHAYD